MWSGTEIGVVGVLIYAGVFFGPGVLGIIITMIAAAVVRSRGGERTVGVVGLASLVVGHVAFFVGLQVLMDDNGYYGDRFFRGSRFAFAPRMRWSFSPPFTVGCVH